jgi:glycosyltransferase involved in cell wall biosynthesis
MKISGFVTVIVPVHNGALHIRRCLEAIAAQTYRPLEIVVVDDGSTDPTPGWVRSFRAQHPEIPVHVHTQAQSGTGMALQAGLLRARGEFVAFAHQADEWHPEKLAKQIKALQGAPQAAYVLGAIAEKQEAGLALKGDKALEERKKPAPSFKLGLLYDAVALSSLAVRREALEEVGGFRDTPQGACGHDLVSRLSQTLEGTSIKDEVAVCHRDLGASVAPEALLATWTRLYQDNKLSRQQLQWGTGRLQALYGWRALLADEPDRARAIFQAAAKADPYRFDVWVGLAFAKVDKLLFATGFLHPETPKKAST